MRAMQSGCQADVGVYEAEDGVAGGVGQGPAGVLLAVPAGGEWGGSLVADSGVGEGLDDLGGVVGGGIVHED